MDGLHVTGYIINKLLCHITLSLQLFSWIKSTQCNLLLILIFTYDHNTRDQSASWWGHSCLASEEIPCSLWNLQVSSGFPIPNFVYLLYFPCIPHAPPIHLNLITLIIYCEELKYMKLHIMQFCPASCTSQLHPWNTYCTKNWETIPLNLSV
jgi:hypothetical protein